MTINISYYGINKDYLTDAFLDGVGDFGPTVVSFSSTQVVLESGQNGAITTITGTGFTTDGTGPTGGTVTGVTFEDDSSNVIATYTGLSWSATGLFTGLAEAIVASNESDSFEPTLAIWSIFASDSYVIDASSANRGFNFINANLTEPVTFIGSRKTDAVIGSSGDDNLKGFRGNDGLYTGKGNDRVDGGKGSDFIWTGKGRDKIKGGADGDMFIFNGKKNEGKTVIKDFADGEDAIWIHKNVFGDLTITQTGDDTKVETLNGTRIILKNFDADDLTEDDFNFGGLRSFFDIIYDVMA